MPKKSERYDSERVKLEVYEKIKDSLGLLSDFIRDFREHVDNKEIEGGTLRLNLNRAIKAADLISVNVGDARVVMEKTVKGLVRYTDDQLEKKRETGSLAKTPTTEAVEEKPKSNRKKKKATNGDS